MEDVMYEKDGTISKMKQFDYKIHKYKPGKTIINSPKEDIREDQPKQKPLKR